MVLGAFIATKIVVLFALAWNRVFIMDEFAQLGWAKYLGHGMFRTVWPSKTVGFTVFAKLADLIGWNAKSVLLVGRMETALLACGTLAIVYASARAIGEMRRQSGLVVLILLCFSNFIERVFETRAEPLATFFGAAALLVAVWGEPRPRRVFFSGILGGLAFLSTQKAIYLDVALGLALVGDSLLHKRNRQAVVRGGWLVFGWSVPVVLYCFGFGGNHPLPIAQNLVFGPLGVASPQTAAEYGGLRHFVVQTLIRNSLLYLFCFGGMALALARLPRLSGSRRIALIFSVVITALVFAHNQPWPYIFVMALPFLALWAPEAFDALAGKPLYLAAAWAVLVIAIGASFVRNVQTLRLDNHAQLALVARAEKLLAPHDVYFDGIGMLPNRAESSTLWLDRHAILETRREGHQSEAWGIFAHSPPKIILWSYRMEAIEPVVGPLIRESYVQVAPNVRIAGIRLRRGQATAFNVPIGATYALYDLNGVLLRDYFNLDGSDVKQPVPLKRGPTVIVFRIGPPEALLLPEGVYAGLLKAGADDKSLFARVYE